MQDKQMKEPLSPEFTKFSYYYFRTIEVLCRLLARISPLLLFDKIYCSAKYRRIFGKKLNLKNPQTFNEKIQWLKLYDRNPLYMQLADKYAVREYVKDRIGEQYLKKMLGVFSSVDEIEFERLPDKFVMKATHGSHWNIFCEDKEKIDIEETKDILRKWLKINWYHEKGEWNYKNIPPRIICEEYLDGDKQLGLVDYKFYCFRGNPKFIDVILGGSLVDYHWVGCMEGLYNEKWELQPFSYGLALPNKEIPQPPQFDLMMELARKLSSDLVYCRVDLNNFNGNVFFGEITFYDQSGFNLFTPPDYDYKLGEYLNLPDKSI